MIFILRRLHHHSANCLDLQKMKHLHTLDWVVLWGNDRNLPELESKATRDLQSSSWSNLGLYKFVSIPSNHTKDPYLIEIRWREIPAAPGAPLRLWFSRYFKGLCSASPNRGPDTLDGSTGKRREIKTARGSNTPEAASVFMGWHFRVRTARRLAQSCTVHFVNQGVNTSVRKPCRCS